MPHAFTDQIKVISLGFAMMYGTEIKEGKVSELVEVRGYGFLL